MKLQSAALSGSAEFAANPKAHLDALRVVEEAAAFAADGGGASKVYQMGSC